MLDPKVIQWIASVLLILSGVQNLVVLNRASIGASLRPVSLLIGLAAVAAGVYLIVTLLSVKT